MADPQISTILIPALVVQMNQQQFVQNGLFKPQTLDVPCRSVLPDDVGYWAIPVKDEGIFSKLQFVLQKENGVTIPQPTFDSFQVFRLRDKLSGYTWWIYGTRDNWLNSCATCCGVASVPMPGIDGGFAPLIAPCQTLCEIKDVNGNYQAIFGIPNVIGHEMLFPYGSYNNAALPTASGSGYANVTALLVFLNASWKTVGTPNANFTWTASTDGQTLFGTGGFLSDSLCVTVTLIGGSS